MSLSSSKIILGDICQKNSSTKSRAVQVASPLNLGNHQLYFSGNGLGSSLNFKGAKTLPKCLSLLVMLGWSSFGSELELDAIFWGRNTFSNSGSRAVLTSDGVRSPLLATTLLKGGMLSPSSKLGVWTMNGITRGMLIDVVNESIPQ